MHTQQLRCSFQVGSRNNAEISEILINNIKHTSCKYLIPSSVSIPELGSVVMGALSEWFNFVKV